MNNSKTNTDKYNPAFHNDCLNIDFGTAMMNMNVETHGCASLQPFTRKPKSISSFIAGFKSAVNTKIDDFIDENKLDIPKYNKKNHFFQSNYHDHIIRNEKSYQTISDYILNNPLKWNEDKFNPSNMDKVK